jgi:hypothetical protein
VTQEEAIMAFDDVPGGDPRGPCCKGCKAPITQDQASIQMHFREDPDGSRGLSGQWHSECARPYWDTITPLLNRLKSWR